MSDKLFDPSVASQPRTALTELRSTRDDFSRFFGDVFDQLQLLSLEMFAEHKCLETAGPQANAASVKAASAELKSQIDQCLDEMRRTHDTLKAQSQFNEEYKRLALLQHAEMAGELRRMHALLETLNQHVRVTPAAHGPPEHRPSAAINGAALSTVLAEADFLHEGVVTRHTG